jgi:uncharacterized C2H2 Zn-finger protein
MIHKCPKCNYLTTLKSNLTRHVVRKHPEEVKYEDPDDENINQKPQNINQESQNIDSLIPENGLSFQCEKCTKVLANNKSLKYIKKIYLSSYMIMSQYGKF